MQRREGASAKAEEESSLSGAKKVPNGGADKFNIENHGSLLTLPLPKRRKIYIRRVAMGWCLVPGEDREDIGELLVGAQGFGDLVVPGTNGGHSLILYFDENESADAQLLTARRSLDVREDVDDQGVARSGNTRSGASESTPSLNTLVWIYSRNNIHSAQIFHITMGRTFEGGAS